VKRPSASELLATDGSLMNTSDMTDLGLTRAAIDAILKQIPVVYIEGSRRPFVHAEDLRRLLAESTYTGSHVR
jgi:hypothetical protein